MRAAPWEMQPTLRLSFGDWARGYKVLVGVERLLSGLEIARCLYLARLIVNDANTSRHRSALNPDLESHIQYVQAWVHV